MKIKSKIYAEALIQSLEGKGKISDIAKSFLRLLHKNKQGKELSRILTETEKIYAEKHGYVLIEIISGKSLDESTTKEITQKIEKMIGKKVTVKQSVKKDIDGVIVRFDDRVLDLSLDNQILKLKKAINK